MFRIQQCRQDMGMSQQELADWLGVTRQAISLYEKEEREPKLEVWIKMAKYFNVDVAYLQGVSDVKKSPTLDELEMLQGDRDLYCPYCGTDQMDPWEISIDEGETECDYCGREFHYEREVEVVYSSMKLEEVL